MISMFMFFISFFVSLKDYIFYVKFFFLDMNILFMIMVFPIVFLVVYSSAMSWGSWVDLWVFKITFFFFFFFLFFCFISTNSFLFLFFLEMCSCFMIFFIFNYAKDSDKISSAIFMFLTNVMGSIPFMFFCWSLVFQSGWLFSGLCLSSFMVFLFYSLILCSKLPIFMLHFWLTKAHVSASGTASVILASLMLKIGSMGFLKWGCSFSFKFSKYLIFVLSFSLITGILVLLVMNRLFDIKYLVACSSISHMSLTFPFFILDSAKSFYSSMIMMVGHGLTSCVLFFLVTFIYEAGQDRSIVSNKSMESSSYLISMIMIFWFILNLGFPPFVSFISEMMFLFILNYVSMVLSFIFILILLLSGLYFINIVSTVLFFKKNNDSKDSVNMIMGLYSIFIVFPFFMLSFFF